MHGLIANDNEMTLIIENNEENLEYILKVCSQCITKKEDTYIS